jgi:hypothetical protein
MPTWTTMTVLETGDLVTEADLDAMRGNIEYLLDPSKQSILRFNGTSYSTTSSAFVDIDATNLSISLTTYGGPVLVTFTGNVYAGTTGQRILVDFTVDGTRYANSSYGLVQIYNPGTSTTNTQPVTFAVLLTGLSAGSHTFKMQWAIAGGSTAYLITNTAFCPVQFSAIEL